MLWDSNALRVPTVAEVDRRVQEFVTKYPRSSFPELKTHPAGAPDAFRAWAQESHQVAVDWAYELRTLSDPNKDVDTDRLVQNMVRFILDGIAPVDAAPRLPDGYWDRLQVTAQRRMTLAGYGIAGLLISAADQIEAQTKFAGR